MHFGWVDSKLGRGEDVLLVDISLRGFELDKVRFGLRQIHVYGEGFVL